MDVHGVTSIGLGEFLMKLFDLMLDFTEKSQGLT